MKTRETTTRGTKTRGTKTPATVPALPGGIAEPRPRMYHFFLMAAQLAAKVDRREAEEAALRERQAADSGARADDAPLQEAA